MTDNQPLTESELVAIQERCDAERDAIVPIETILHAQADISALLAEVRRLKRANDRLWAENAKLAAGWASVDTTKLADITDLDECKRRLQRERERSHGAIRDLCDLANTPAGAYKERLDAANAELAKLRAVADAAGAVVEDGQQTPNCDEYDAAIVFSYDVSSEEFHQLRDALAALEGGDDGTDADGK